MSCKNRGTITDPKDFYPTPEMAFVPLLAFLPHDTKFWEPCAGDGRIIKWLHDSGRQADGADLFPQVIGDITPLPAIDYLKDETQREFVITNPPFSLAFEMCQHALNHSMEFMFLLRLSFLESLERSEWLSENEPDALFVLKRRPSFVMSVTCKSPVAEPSTGRVLPCGHNWILPINSERSTECPKCGGGKLSISTSDNAAYGWFYWGPRYQGFKHI